MTFVVPSSATTATVAEFMVDAVPPLVAAAVIVTVVFCAALIEVWPYEWLFNAIDLGATVVGPLPDEDAPQQLLPPRSGFES